MEETNEKTIFLIVLMLIIIVGVSVVAKTEAKENTDIAKNSTIIFAK